MNKSAFLFFLFLGTLVSLVSKTSLANYFEGGRAVITVVTTGGGTVCAGTTPANVVFTFNGSAPNYDLVYSINGVSQAPVTGITLSSFTITNPGAGIYKVVSVTNGVDNGIGTDSAIVVINALPLVVANTDKAVLCIGSSAVLTGSGANTYSWDNGVVDGVSFSPSSTKIYTVTGSDLNGCSKTASVSVTVKSLPIVVADVTDDSVCTGLPITFRGRGATAYSWTGGITNGVPFIITSNGTYTVTGTDASGCVNTASVSVFIKNDVKAGFTFLPASPQTEDTIKFTNTSTPTNISYDWNFGESAAKTNSKNPTHIYEEEGVYTVLLTVKDAKGCKDTMSAKITVQDVFNFTAPNIFTPNNDNSNDVFEFKKSKGVKELECQIFDRYGLRVYQFSGAKGAWDGFTQSGSLCPAGTYYYIIKLTSNTSESKEYNGTVTLMR